VLTRIIAPSVTSIALASGGIALASGCATESPGDAAEPRAHAGSSTDDLRATPRQRGTVIGGERVARSIAWPTADRIDVAARDRLGAGAREAIGRAPVPVLVPADHPDAQVFTGETWVAVSAHGEGYTIHVQGSAQARVYPHIGAFDPTHPLRTDDGFVTRNEGVWSFSWIEHGAAYSAEIECDARVVAWCDDEAAVTKMVDAFVLAGGREEAP